MTWQAATGQHSAPALMSPSLLPGQSGHMRGVVSHHGGYLYDNMRPSTRLWQSHNRRYCLTAGSHNRGTTAEAERIPIPDGYRCVFNYYAMMSGIVVRVLDLWYEDCRFESWPPMCKATVPLGKAFYWLVHSLNPGKNGSPVSDSDSWCEQLLSRAITGSIGCKLPWEQKMVFESTGLINRVGVRVVLC